MHDPLYVLWVAFVALFTATYVLLIPAAVVL